MSIQIEIRGPSPRCLFPREKSFVYFFDSHLCIFPTPGLCIFSTPRSKDTRLHGLGISTGDVQFSLSSAEKRNLLAVSFMATL